MMSSTVSTSAAESKVDANESQTTTTAASKTARCPRCNALVTSYGVMEDYSNVNVSVSAGNKCNGCGTTVAAGTAHWYYYTTDLYYFLCNSSTCSKLNVTDRVFTVEYENAVKEHVINNISQ